MKNTFLIYGTIFFAILQCVVNENAVNGSNPAGPEKLDLIIESDGLSPSGVSLNVVEGDSFTLVCKIKGEYTALKDNPSFSWFIGEDIEGVERKTADNTEGITIKDTAANESSLIVNAANFNHRAVYLCEIDSDLGIGKAQVLVRVKDKLAALWPFLGIVGEVVILCAIIFIYEKRRSKPDFEESETDNAEGKSPQTSAKGQEVRQRK